ncbi:MAG: DUF721 domain-containing protein [Kangiellaceae bacterium]|nr:DUF721 domain-containing protein [Kangiellaceae bacterium]
MPKKRPKTVNNLINQPDGDIKALMDRLVKIRTVDESVKSFLSPSVAEHCRVVNIRKSTLVLAVDSPLWVNKIRFQLTELMSYLRTNGFISLGNIDLIVQPRE